MIYYYIVGEGFNVGDREEARLVYFVAFIVMILRIKKLYVLDYGEVKCGCLFLLV